MSKALKGLGIAIVIIGIVLSASMFIIQFPTTAQVPYQVQVPYQTTETQTQNLDHKENYQIPASHWAYSNFTLDAGKTLVFSWSTDSSVSAYVLSSSQYSSFRLLGIAFSALASKTASPSGTITYQVQDTELYFVVITNPSSMNPVNVASYSSNLQWQQEVTKYRTETQYRTETVYSTSSFGINLGISVLVLGCIITPLSFVNIKPIMIKAKTINRSTCVYCGSTYKKNLDQCPHCGARNKVVN